MVLELGGGTAAAFLGAWREWRKLPEPRPRLHWVAIEPPSLTAAQLRRLHPGDALAECLAAAWPPVTPDLYRLAFEGGAVQCLIGFGDAPARLAALRLHADALWVDARHAASSQRLPKALARLAAHGTMLEAGFSSPDWLDALRSAGFVLEDSEPGTTRGRYAPAFASRRRAPAPPAARDARIAIVGGGLAGCAVAWALAEQGHASTVLDRHTQPAGEASGNPAGLFHGVFHGQDSVHARFSRAAAWEAARAVRVAIAEDGVKGSADGLLRLDTSGRSAAELRAQLAAQRMPPEVLQALDAEQASATSGIALAHPAWWYPQGGWVDPAGLARSFLRRAGQAVSWRGGFHVARLEALAKGAWRLHGIDGSFLDADIVVLANAMDALRLGDAGWPLEAVRGQLSSVPASGPFPRVPVAGSGYVLPAIDGMALFGATAQAGDADPSVRAADHAENLDTLQRLSPQLAEVLATSALWGGRVGWRATVADRLPLIGAVPLATDRSLLPRDAARCPGLFVFAGLGSRGITWAALGGQAVASAITGAPWPLDAGLRDAVDPARFLARAARRAAG